MRNSKVKSKKNLAVPGEPMSPKEFVALIKEAEKGPFKSIDNLVEDVKLQWEKNYKTEKKSDSIISGENLTREEFLAVIKKAEDGPFYTHHELVTKLNSWKKSLKK